MTRATFARILRMVWIDATLAEEGELRRADIQRAFMISTPQASADIAMFNRLYPKIMGYDASSKLYVKIEGTKPAYSARAHRTVNDAVNLVMDLEHWPPHQPAKKRQHRKRKLEKARD